MASALLLVACAPAARLPGSSGSTSPGAAAPPEPLSEFDPSRYHFTRTFPREHEAPALIPPARPACTLSAVDWTAALRLDAEAEVFAEVPSTNQVTVLVPDGDASQGAFVEVHAPGLLLEGRVVASEISLGLRRSTLLGGYAWTRNTKALTWKRASGAGVELELDPGSRVRPLRGLPSAVLACKDLTLETTSAGAFDARVTLSRGQAVREAKWIGDERVPLSLSPMGSPVAELDTRPESDEVEPESDEVEPESDEAEPERALVIGTRPGFRRVLYALEDSVIMGWVPASALRVDTEHDVELLDLSEPSAEWGWPLSPFGGDDPTRFVQPSEPEVSRHCVWNAPLTVEIAGVKRQVGAIASGIPLVLGAERDGLREVTFEHASLNAVPTAARFWVPERLLYPCLEHGEPGG